MNLRCNISSCNAAVAGELGQYPLIIFHKTLMLKYWVKVISGPRDRLRYIMYTFLKEMTMSNQRVTGCKNRAAEIRNILTEVGQVGVCYSENLGMSIDEFISMSMSTLVDLYIQEWWRELLTKKR